MIATIGDRVYCHVHVPNGLIVEMIGTLLLSRPVLDMASVLPMLATLAIIQIVANRCKRVDNVGNDTTDLHTCTTSPCIHHSSHVST
jgi:hypothetical protein